MKKIALLILTAVFVIGIQSCSKEDEVINQQEQQGDVIAENAISADVLLKNSNIYSKNLRLNENAPSCYRKILVVFPDFADSQDHLDYLEYARKVRFSSIFAITTPKNCTTRIYEWYVPCNEIPKNYCTIKCGLREIPKTEGTATIPADKDRLNDNNEEDPVCEKCLTNSNIGWVSGSNPSCEKIIKSVSFSSLILN